MRAFFFLAVVPAVSLAFLPTVRRPTLRVKTATSLYVVIPQTSNSNGIDHKDDTPELERPKHCIPLEEIDLDDLPKVGGYVN